MQYMRKQTHQGELSLLLLLLLYTLIGKLCLVVLACL